MSFGCCTLLLGVVYYGVDSAVNVVATYLYCIDAFLTTSDFQLLLLNFLYVAGRCFRW
jgi:hypothetical protein